MLSYPVVGARSTMSIVVGDDDLVPQFFEALPVIDDGSHAGLSVLPVWATAAAVVLVEAVAMAAIDPHLAPHEAAMAVDVLIAHCRPSLPGAHLTATGRCEAVNRALDEITYEVTITNEHGDVVGYGWTFHQVVQGLPYLAHAEHQHLHPEALPDRADQARRRLRHRLERRLQLVPDSAAATASALRSVSSSVTAASSAASASGASGSAPMVAAVPFPARHVDVVPAWRDHG